VTEGGSKYMSRVDEALRRAAGTLELPDDRDRDNAAEPSAHVGAASTLEQYVVERPPELTESVEREPALVPAPTRTDGLARPVKFPPALRDKLIVSENISPAIVEQYRRLATVLHDHHLHSGLKTLMVSSAVPREGKTLTIVNLALTLSDSFHERVLLIDADLRRPSLHEVFGIPNQAGLADSTRVGIGAMPLVEVSPRLSVLTAGRAKASPLASLASDRVRSVVSDAASHFDWVLLDTPPVGLLPDARIVARLSEAILFVIAAGLTPYALVKRCIAELGADRIVGTVLNRVQPEALGANGYDGGYYK
jgi:capsular exopolysaccharide synthesis family protein